MIRSACRVKQGKSYDTEERQKALEKELAAELKVKKLGPFEDSDDD